MLRTVATDGHRLASIEVPLPEGAAGMPGVIVLEKTVTELRKLIDETVDDVLVAMSDTKIRFSFDGAVLTSKLIDGTFPTMTGSFLRATIRSWRWIRIHFLMLWTECRPFPLKNHGPLNWCFPRAI